MEFRKCPDCQASVLEDDVEECPFCGASMSGKPRPKPPASKPEASAPTKPPATQAGAAGASSGSPAGKRPASASGRPAGGAARPSAGEPSEDPFEVDTSAVRRAVKLSPRPSKVRTVEVTCPMCETKGYMPPEVAGKDVHCCNPECMVPVFKSPRPKKVEAPKEEPKSNKGMLIGATVGGLVVLGGIAWFLMSGDSNDAPVTNAEPTQQISDEDRFGNLTPQQNTIVVATQKLPETADEIRKQSLENIQEKAKARDRNRNQAYGVQLAAEALAESAKYSEATTHIQRLQAIARNTPYFQVQPYVDIGWGKLNEGKRNEADQAATSALGRSKSMPRTIRKTHDAAASLAALLIALDRNEDAKSVIAQEMDSTPRGKLSALWKASIDGKTFSIDDEAKRPWHQFMLEPINISVVESLAAYNQTDKALQFAMTLTPVTTQDAALAAIAGRLVLVQKDAAQSKVESIAQQQGISPTGTARVWAAVAAAHLANNNRSSAEAALGNALSAFEKVTIAPARNVPGKKEIHDNEGKPFAGLSQPAPARSAAFAAADIGTVQMRLGQREAAWGHFQKSLDALRSTTPSPVATDALLQECQNQEMSIQRELNSALRLDNDGDRMRRAFIRYRNQVRRLHEEAEARWALQQSVIRLAASEGLLNEAWNLMKERNDLGNSNEKEAYFKTTTATYVQQLASTTGQTALADEMKPVIEANSSPADILDTYYAVLGERVAAGRIPQTRESLRDLYRSNVARQEPDRTDELALRIIGRVQKALPPEDALDFIKRLDGPVLKEDAFLLYAGESFSLNTANKLWQLVTDSRDLEALDQISAYRGFISGLSTSSHKGDFSEKPANE